MLSVVAETNTRGSTLLRERSANVDLQEKLGLFKHVDTVRDKHSDGCSISLPHSTISLSRSYLSLSQNSFASFKTAFIGVAERRNGCTVQVTKFDTYKILIQCFSSFDISGRKRI